MNACLRYWRRYEGTTWKCLESGRCPESQDGILRLAPQLTALNNGLGADAFVHVEWTVAHTLARVLEWIIGFERGLLHCGVNTRGVA